MEPDGSGTSVHKEKSYLLEARPSSNPSRRSLPCTRRGLYWLSGLRVCRQAAQYMPPPPPAPVPAYPPMQQRAPLTAHFSPPPPQPQPGWVNTQPGAPFQQPVCLGCRALEDLETRGNQRHRPIKCLSAHRNTCRRSLKCLRRSVMTLSIARPSPGSSPCAALKGPSRPRRRTPSRSAGKLRKRCWQGSKPGWRCSSGRATRGIAPQRHPRR